MLTGWSVVEKFINSSAAAKDMYVLVDFNRIYGEERSLILKLLF